MRLRLMATYRGVPYQVGLGPDGTQATLLSPGPPPAGLGFTAQGGHWRKQVDVTDIEALWLSRPAGTYQGEPCLVLDDLGDRLHIAYRGRDTARAAQLGYWEIDREVFEVVVARQDVADLTEERVEFPVSAATFGPPEPAPGAGGPEEEQTAVAEEAPAASEVPAGNGLVPGNGVAAGMGVAAGNGVAAGTGTGAGNGHRAPDYGLRKPDRMTAWHGSPEPWSGSTPGPGGQAEPGGEPGRGHQAEPGGAGDLARASGRRTGRKGRVSPESYFAELLSLAAIPHSAYSVGREVPGAMCLIEADGGFEVFTRTDDARLEVQFFADEEAAYFYLFGVLAAEAVRSGRLGVPGTDEANGQQHGPNGSGAENVSKYLRR